MLRMTEPKQPTAPAAPKKAVDWDAIEPHYRSGIRSLKDIGKEYGVSDAAIVKHAKKAEWTRNLKAKIQARADAKVSAAAVSAEVSANKALTEKVVIEANAEVQTRIRLAHRTDIARGRKLFGSLLAEIEAETDNLALFQRLGELLDTSGTDENGRNIRDLLNEAYQKVISTTGRVDAAKKLTEMLEKLVRMEREAFGIEGAGSNGDDPLTSLLAKIGRSAMPVVKEVPEDDDQG